MAPPVADLSRSDPVTEWPIIMLSGAVMDLDLTETGDGRLLPGGHTPLWLVACVPGGALIGATYR